MTNLTTGLELIMNACEGVLQIAITDDEKVLCFQEWFSPKRATETLAPALKNIFELLRISPRNFKRIACFCGPGSFTGIRLILSTAAAFRRVGDARLASLDYLQALATSAAIRRGLPYGQKIFVLTYARANLTHFREFISYGPQIPAQPLSELLLISPDEALKKISDLSCHVCGSSLEKFPQIFINPYGNIEKKNYDGPVYMTNLVNPGLEALCLLARHGDYFPKDLEPLYARSCDAVDNLKNIAEKRGEDPEEAMRKLNALITNDVKSDL